MKRCNVSTGIHGDLTFGKGELDDYGYWEKPCPICARKAEKRNKVKKDTYWPFSNCYRMNIFKKIKAWLGLDHNK